ncbi:MAG: PEP-CTERM sorting domain-containing protein [Candidatus Omnitrophica bacterium]|nr:PEP-CTERM sorting domain-containing protein [Candidatus Omnitrophota bacterium]
MKQALVVTGLLLVVALCAAPAGATLIGDQVNATLTAYGMTWINNQSATVVDPGVEFSTITGLPGVVDNAVDIDLSASQISITFTQLGQGFVLLSDHVLTLSNLDWVGDPTCVIAGLSLVSGSSNFSFTPVVSNVTDDGFQITIPGSNGYPPVADPEGEAVPLDVGPSLTATWDILTRNAEIPEPTTMALLGMGAAGLIAKRRRVI